MPTKRLSMRKIKEILRLKWAKGLSNRQIARTCGVGRPTVAEYLRRAAKAGLGWPLPDGLEEATLESGSCSRRRHPYRPRPAACPIGSELKGPGSNLSNNGYSVPAGVTTGFLACHGA